MEQFVSAIIGGDVSKIAETADSMLNIFDNTKKEEKWLYLFTKCKQLGISSTPTVDVNISFDNLLVSYNPNSLFLEPWDVPKIPKLHIEQFNKQFPDMASMNGFTKSWVTIMMFGEMFGSKMFNSNITKVFMTYLSLFDEEPFVEFTDGTIVLASSCRDAAVTLRVKLYIRTIWEEMTGKLDSDIAFETFYYLFKNPQRHTMDLKDWKGPLLNAAMSGSNDGYTCAWNDSSLKSFTLKPMPDINPDLATRNRLKHDTDEALANMAKAGMVKTAAKFKSLINCTVSQESVADFSTLWFLEAVSGFFRSNFPNTAIDSISKSRANKFYREGSLVKDELYDIWYRFFTSYIEKIPETQEEYVLELMSDLTTRSNGLNKFRLVDGEVIPNPDLISVDIEASTTNRSKRKMKWTFNDKALSFRALLEDPHELFDYYKMISTMSYEDPGRFFTRVVAARKVRMVYGINLFRFNTERYTRYMYEWLADMRYPEAITGRTQYPISTLAIDTGRYLTEMGRYLFYTGNPSMDALILLADFGNFDQTQVYENFRTYMIKAAEDACYAKAEILQTRKFDILGGMTPMDHLLGHWKTCNNAVFAVHTNSKENKTILLETGWLYSGENGTLVINTATNLAFVRTVMRMMPTVKVQLSIGEITLDQFIDFESFKLQGDDQIAIIQKLIRNLNPQDQTLIYSAFLNLLGTVADSCGIDISINKTGLRCGHFEFLKKAGIWGYAVPRYMQISLEEQETINRTLDPIERFRSRLGQEREYIYRGGSTVYGLIRLYCEWNIIRAVYFGKNVKDSSVYYRLPFELIWTPVSKGGCGMHPTNNTDPNVDMILAMYEWPEHIRDRINLCIEACGSAPKKDNSFIVNQVAERLQGGMKVERAYDHKAKSNIILQSKQAHERLISKGMKPDKNAYYLRYEQSLLEAIEDNPKINTINSEWKQVRSEHIIKYMKLHPKPSTDHLTGMTIPGVRFESIEVIQNDCLPINPVAGLDPFLGEWLRQIGTSSESKVVSGDEFKRLSALLNRGSFPRNLKANNVESIAATLLRHNFISAEDISDFLIMRGADIEPALEVGQLLAKRLDMLQYLASVSAFSFVGEGFTDKSKERIDELVQFLNPVIDNDHTFPQTIKSLAYQYMRVQPLWVVKDGKLDVNPRRRVLIHITDETIAQFLFKGITNYHEDRTGMYEQMMREAVYIDNYTPTKLHEI